MFSRSSILFTRLCRFVIANMYANIYQMKLLIQKYNFTQQRVRPRKYTCCSFDNYLCITTITILQSIYWFLKVYFWKFCLELVQAVSILGVTKLSGRCRRPISYSELLRNNRPTPDSDTCNVCGLANVFFIRLIFGLKPSRKFWKIQ